MFLIHSDGVYDFDLEFLKEILALIDVRIDKLAAKAKNSSDPDGSGVYDRSEAIVGLGFAACQQYINATYPQLDVKNKGMALSSGPRHASGAYVADVINAAANFWKHHDEWRADGSKREARTRAVVESIGLSVPSAYLLSNVLFRMLRPQPSRFRSVVPLLIEWRDHLIGQRRQSRVNLRDT